jgi:transcriptional regulator with XRE-family HTH domain
VERNGSQECLAFESNVDRSYLGGLERGEESRTVDVRDRLAVTLGVPIGELFASHKDNGRSWHKYLKPVLEFLRFNEPAQLL